MTPKIYKALTTIPKSDPFAGGQQRQVQGYYVKHISATPNPISTAEEHAEFVKKHTKHYIINDGFSDWGLPCNMEVYEIDISTMEEVSE